MAKTWRTEDARRAQIHFDALASRLRAEAHYTDKPEKWSAHEATRQVWVPRPTSGVRYMVCLHELGHIGSLTARRWVHRYQEPGVEVLVEGAAWSWATMMADPALSERLTARDWAEVGELMVSYMRWTAQQKIPKPGAAAKV
jgi:hypothetical protein